MPSLDLAANAENHNLYKENHAWLSHWFFAQLGCRHQSADLTQDVFVKVMVRQQYLQDQAIHSPRGFLRVIAKGLLFDYYRRRSVEQAFFEVMANAPEAVVMSTEEREILLETLDQIALMLDRMPFKVRRVFLRSQLDGLTYTEIAQEMKISIRTVSRYMHQAFRQCLRAQFE
ncbi:MAG: sigma-70 family RNA polymerase sigma factor [Pseudomonadota bacterium]